MDAQVTIKQIEISRVFLVVHLPWQADWNVIQPGTPLNRGDATFR